MNNENKKERRSIYRIDGMNYTVITRVTDNLKNIYEIFAKSVLRKLNEM